MESKTTKSYRHCPDEDYEINIFICRGRQKAHYPKCPECEFRTTTEKIAPIEAEKETEKPSPPRQIQTGSIMVKSEPPSADIYLDGDNIGLTPAIITQILPGRYKIKIKMDGYHIWDQNVDVKTNKETSLTAVLKGKVGSIAIDSEPANAEITIDGSSAGTTPVTLNNVKAGKYLVEVNLEGYETWSKEINVGSDKKTSLIAKLITEYGSVSLDSEPTNAKILLDGIEFGTTPASLKSIPLGIHSVKVSMEGYNVWEESVDVESGKEKALTAVLQLKTGSVSIKSQPTNAEIYLDGKHVSTTPERIISITPGTHEIKVSMDKYDDWSEIVNVEPDKEKAITALLQRSTGSLMVESGPENATIFFDGKKIGTTPEIIMSSVKGMHTLEVRMDGFHVWKEDVEIEPGSERSLLATLQQLTGSLNITSKPINAIITVNDNEVGNTPASITDLLPGKHHVEVRMEGYKNWSECAVIKHSKETSLSAVLQQLTGSLNITSNPVNAITTVDGNEVGNTPASITDLVPGKHRVEARMDGYESWSESVVIEHSKETSLSVELLQLTGSLNITSKPINAIITLDDNEVGSTPASITDLVPGKHHVEARMDGYESWSESVVVEHSKETSLSVELLQLTGSLNITSKPTNAIITVDDNEVGSTPASITDLVPGKHRVEARMDGYESWSESVVIEHSKETSLSVELLQLTGFLNITSKPTNAIITVDDNEVGSTPASITDLVPGKHHVETRMDGYESWSESVVIEHSKETSLSVELQQLTGDLNITSNPVNAMITIDGNEVGNTPASITGLVPGEHLVEARMEGYGSWSEGIVIEHSKEASLSAELQQLTGSFNIMSEPVDATITVDGNEVGNTPASITGLVLGKHLVEVRMDGYKNWSEHIVIEYSKDTVLTAVLQYLTGSVSIKSRPANAIILIDGKEAENTPATITGVKPGTYMVEVEKDGYESWSKNVVIEHSKETSLSVELQQLTGALNITSNPVNAMITIDGNEVGNTPASITGLVPGEHLVEARMEGYGSWSEGIVIEHSKEASLSAELQQLTGSFNIMSEPVDATITVDGNEVGNTPASITGLVLGKHLVEVRMDGYKNWSEHIVIEYSKETVLTAVLQYLTGSVSIKSRPANAIILIDGKEAENTPATVTGVKPGTYMVEVEKEGYESWSKNVVIEHSKETSLSVELQQLTGALNITSTPENAMITIAGNEVGNTPATITDLVPGKHHVEARMDGYKKWSQSVDIEYGKEASITVALQLKAGSICIESEPSIAVVLIDDEEIGTTPLFTTDISPGIHKLEIKRYGYEIWRENIEIEIGKEASLIAVLQLKAGPVTIESVPSDAMIYIDGQKVDTTPLTITDPGPGEHSVEVKMNGYETWNKSINVGSGKAIALTATLQIKVGTVSIISEPSDAVALIDSKEVGRTPVIITDLSQGTHLVEVRMDDHKKWQERVDIESGKEITITANLQIKSGQINIHSNPPEAIIYIDDNKVGNTPKTITNLSPGTHTVEITKDRYESWSKSIDVSGNKENTLTAELQVITAPINISSNPSGAVICLDGEQVGTTPDIIVSVPLGTHEVEIKMDGYVEWKKELDIKERKEAILTVVLHPNTGTVSIESGPTEAVVLLDGKDVGKTPVRLTGIKIGMYEVELQKNGYASWNKTIEIETNIENTLTAKLISMAGSVNINSKPPNAIILIDGKNSGNTPAIITDLSASKHLVEVKMDGFEMWCDSVDISPGKEAVVMAELQKKPGSICIKSNPSEAIILIDNEEVGTTPKVINDLDLKKHIVQVRMDGYEFWNESISIRPGVELSITADLKMKAGPVNINSEPSNAMIFVDDKNVGQTPKTLTGINPGEHLVEICMDGYETWSESVDVRSEKENVLSAVLKQITGSISIKCSHSEAIIYLDGKEIDPTSDAIKSIAIGTHEIEVKMEGHAEWKKTVNIKRGKETSLNAVLRPITGIVSLDSVPSEAMIFLDGENIGKTPKIMNNIKTGTHEVEVQKDGYVSWKKTIKIKAGRENTLTVNLLRMTGSVNINSKPSNATVLIDGKKAGYTPAIIADLSATKHLIEVKVDEYEIWCESVYIDPGKETVVIAELQTKPGSICIKSNPSEAIILINNEEVGTTPKVINDLDLEKHIVQVRMDGYEVWNESISIRPGVELSITADLKMKAGSVNINSEPSNAMIFVDDKNVGQTPKTLTGINPGEHLVGICMDGYETWSESVDVRSERENVLDAILQKIAGSISIKCSHSEAIIYLDGNEVGPTSGTIKSVAIGTHEVEVRMEGFAEWKKTVNIKRGKETSINAVLRSITGIVRLESIPSEAMIFIDGENIDKTPKTLTGIKTGRHEVEIRLDGYNSWMKAIKIKAGKEYGFSAALERKTGSLLITSDPPNGTIYVQGNKSGKTPRTVTELIRGNYTVEVKLDEYQTWSENIDIEAGKETILKAVLHAKPGSISIKSKPSNALILIDGNEAGTTPETLNDVERGDHIVELMVDGYEVWRENVEVKANKESYLEAVLQEIACSVSIKSEPPSATILVDGKNAGTTPAIIKNLSPGTHMIDISTDGYDVWSESLEIEAKNEKELTAILQEVKGSITINSGPTNALIFLDGKKSGTTPETITDLKTGMHLVEVSMDGYEVWSESINVTDKKHTMTAELQEVAGSIEIKSGPSNATIILNGKKTGLTPETIGGLSPGTHQVEVVMDGFENWSDNIVVSAGKESTVTAMLKSATGSISVTSTPLEARIHLDGDEVGTTPVTLSSISVGTHEIEVRADGYEKGKRSITVKEGKEKSLNVILQLNVGSISIESYPEKAIIYLDGKEVGKAPKQLTDVIVGMHEVEVLMSGYATWKKTIKTKAGKDISLIADLKEESGPVEQNEDDISEAPDTSTPFNIDTDKVEQVTADGDKDALNPQAQPVPLSTSGVNLQDKLLKLRSVYAKISDSQVESLPVITIREKNSSIFLCHSTINHNYEQKPIGDGDVIIDHATGLMWYQSGSSEYFSLKKAIKWLKKTNKDCYAGFKDWRLPTLEEASSLLEFETKNGSFVDPVFDNKQWGTWTGDKSNRGQAWIVTYVNGTVSQVQTGTPATFVRPVRTLNI